MAATERVVTELVIDAGQAELALKRMEGSFDHLGTRMAAAENKMQASLDKSMRVYGSVPQAIDRIGDAYSRLQGKLDPVVAAQQRAAREMVQSLGTINRAVMLGVTTEQDATATIARLKAQQIEQINRVRDAQAGANAAMSRMHSPANDNSAGFRRQNLIFQSFDVGQSLAGGMNPALVAAQQLPQVVQPYLGEGGLKSALKDVGGLLGSVATKFAPVAVAAGVAALAIHGLQEDITASTGVAVTFGDTAKAVFQAAGDVIMTTLQPAIDTIGPIFASAWDIATAATKDAGNFMVGAMAGTVAAITGTWKQLPSALLDVTVQAANHVLTTVQTMVRNLVAEIEGMINSLSSQLEGTPFAFGGINIDRKAMLGPYGSWRIDNPAEGAAARVGSQIGDAYRGALGKDYIGDAYGNVVGAVSGHAVENARLRELAEAEAKIKKGGADQASAYDRTIESANERIEQMKLETQLLGKATPAADATSLRASLLEQAMETEA